jgi:predicted nucleic acid-binding protein
MLVVDASVAVKWFMDEPDSLAARALVAGGETLVAPELVLAETLNAAWRALRLGQLVDRQYAELADSLPGCFAWLAPLDAIAKRAAIIAQRLDHPVYDCFYLALAERAGASLVTADRRLLGRIAATPWAVGVRALTAATGSA